eukprot:1837010-Amphidinium_carterae.1
MGLGSSVACISREVPLAQGRLPKWSRLLVLSLLPMATATLIGDTAHGWVGVHLRDVRTVYKYIGVSVGWFLCVLLAFVLGALKTRAVLL